MRNITLTNTNLRPGTDEYIIALIVNAENGSDEAKKKLLEYYRGSAGGVGINKFIPLRKIPEVFPDDAINDILSERIRIEVLTKDPIELFFLIKYHPEYVLDAGGYIPRQYIIGSVMECEELLEYIDTEIIFTEWKKSHKNVDVVNKLFSEKMIELGVSPDICDDVYKAVKDMKSDKSDKSDKLEIEMLKRLLMLYKDIDAEKLWKMYGC